MNDNEKCGICGLEQSSSAQRVYPIVTVANGIAIYRCEQHLTVPAREGEGEKYGNYQTKI